MKHIVLVICCVFLLGTAFSQSFSPQVDASSGGFDLVNGSSFSWTLGETIIETEQGGSAIFTQGFHQPVPPKPLITETPYDDYGSPLRVYPNPASGLVNISLGNHSGKRLTVMLFDIRSRLLFSTTIENGPDTYTIDIGAYANGPFLLRLSDKNNQVLNSCIIIKN